jgi:hypothetical protein
MTAIGVTTLRCAGAARRVRRLGFLRGSTAGSVIGWPQGRGPGADGLPVRGGSREPSEQLRQENPMEASQISDDAGNREVMHATDNSREGTQWRRE